MSIVYCVPDEPDAMTRAQLYISAVRTRTHVHETEPCQPCLGDMLGLGAHGFALLNALNDAERKAEVLRAILADLADPDDCWFDHHGYCQAHGWLTEGECPHARAKKALGTDGGDRR